MKTLTKIVNVLRYIITEIVIILFLAYSIILLWSDTMPTIKDVFVLVVLIGYFLFSKLEMIEEKVTKKKDDE